MKEIRTEDAVGQILCHDITQIIKDEKKGVLFSKGHIVKEEDIPLLLSVGKEHLFVWEKKEGILHENEGADILYKICAGDSMHGTDVKEGKIELVADEDGVLKIRRDALLAVNSLGEMMIASRHGDFPVKKGDKLAGTRIIPLVIEKEKMDRAVEAAGPEPIFSILPYHFKKVGIVTTGSEVKKGLIQDTFTPVLKEKLSEYPTEVIGQTTPGDDKAQITDDIMEFINQGADIVVCSGGMSVDLDERTKIKIKAVIQEPELLLTGHRYCQEPCFSSLTMRKRANASRSLGFLDVSCMRSVLYLTWFCQESWQTMKFSRKKLLHTEKAVSA